MERKIKMIEEILSRIFGDRQSVMIDLVTPQEITFFRPVGPGLMIRFRMTWNNDQDFRVTKWNRGKEILQIYNTSIWFRVHDYLRVSFIDVEKYLKFR